MVAGDELVPQFALAGAAHDGAQVERAHLVKGGRRRQRRRFGVRPEDDRPGPVLPPLRRRQGDQAVLVHGQHGDPGHHVLEAAVGLEPADAPAERLRQGMARRRRLGGDQRAQQRHLPDREVAPVIAALDLAGHPGAINSFRRSASIDQGSQGERSSGAIRRCPRTRSATPEPVRDVDAVQCQGADHRIHQRREPGAAPAVGAERQASPYCRPPQQSLGEIVVKRNLGPVDEDAQPLAMVRERA